MTAEEAKANSDKNAKRGEIEELFWILDRIKKYSGQGSYKVETTNSLEKSTRTSLKKLGYKVRLSFFATWIVSWK